MTHLGTWRWDVAKVVNKTNFLYEYHSYFLQARDFPPKQFQPRVCYENNNTSKCCKFTPFLSFVHLKLRSTVYYFHLQIYSLTLVRYLGLHGNTFSCSYLAFCLLEFLDCLLVLLLLLFSFVQPLKPNFARSVFPCFLSVTISFYCPPITKCGSSYSSFS